MTLPQEAVEAIAQAIEPLWFQEPCLIENFPGQRFKIRDRARKEAVEALTKALPHLSAHSAEARPMTVTDEAVKFLPLRYEDGPDYCTVTDKNGSPFALTLRPEILKQMEAALLAAAPLMSAHSAEEPAGWRPIETAPKDGTRVLLAGLSVGVGSWGKCRPQYDGYVAAGGDFVWRAENEEKCFAGKPRGWMPLPSPPVKE